MTVLISSQVERGVAYLDTCTDAPDGIGVHVQVPESPVGPRGSGKLIVDELKTPDGAFDSPCLPSPANRKWAEDSPAQNKTRLDL